MSWLIAIAAILSLASLIVAITRTGAIVRFAAASAGIFLVVGIAAIALLVIDDDSANANGNGSESVTQNPSATPGATSTTGTTADNGQAPRCDEPQNTAAIHCVTDGTKVAKGTIAVIEVVDHDSAKTTTIAYGKLGEEFTPNRANNVDRNAWVGYATVTDAHKGACTLAANRLKDLPGYDIKGTNISVQDCTAVLSNTDGKSTDNQGKSPVSGTPSPRNITIPSFDNDEDKTLPSMDTTENTRQDVDNSSGVKTTPLGTWVWNGNRPAYPATPGNGEYVIAHGDINSSGTCHYIVFEAGEAITGLGEGTFNMYRISGEAKAVYNEIDRHFDQVNVGMICPMLIQDDNKFIH